MRKNWLAAAWVRWFRARPVVRQGAFQDAAEPYPGHWRRFPDAWPAVGAGSLGPQTPEQQAALTAALAGLPELWRQVLTAHDVWRSDDQQVARDLGLTVNQERDILTLARAALRDGLDQTQTEGLR